LTNAVYFKAPWQIPFEEELTETGPFSLIGGGIDEAYHQTFIAIDEIGAEAAAATAIVMNETGIPIPEHEFSADCPFLFLIRDRITGAILFMGRMMDPS
jgi:serine protease inhibitor